MREVERLALDVGAAVEQNEFIIRCGDHGRDAAAIHARYAAEFESCGGENATSIAGRDDAIGSTLLDKFDRPNDGRIFFTANGGSGFVLHGEDFAGMDHAHAMVAKAAF